MRTWILVAALALPALASAQAGNCASIRDGIAASIRGAGVADFELRIVEAGASAPGRVVGRCDLGRRQIVYRAAAAAASAPASEPVLTECRDGSVVRGDCPRSPRR